jgi:hypothetical protein
MKDFSSGVKYYTGGVCQIVFPEDDICCHWCPLMGIELKTDRAYCRRTGEYLIAPKFAVGNQCPIIFDSMGDEDNV